VRWRSRCRAEIAMEVTCIHDYRMLMGSGRVGRSQARLSKTYDSSGCAGRLKEGTMYLLAVHGDRMATVRRTGPVPIAPLPRDSSPSGRQKPKSCRRSLLFPPKDASLCGVVAWCGLAGRVVSTHPGTPPEGCHHCRNKAPLTRPLPPPQVCTLQVTTDCAGGRCVELNLQAQLGPFVQWVLDARLLHPTVPPSEQLMQEAGDSALREFPLLAVGLTDNTVEVWQWGAGDRTCVYRVHSQETCLLYSMALTVRIVVHAAVHHPNVRHSRRRLQSRHLANTPKAEPKIGSSSVCTVGEPILSRPVRWRRSAARLVR
jgi:hypothetical protein